MPNESVTVPNPDGRCPVTIVTPEGWTGGPAVIFFMDAGGIRPAVFEMTQQLADAAYVVLVPDLFYRRSASARHCHKADVAVVFVDKENWSFGNGQPW